GTGIALRQNDWFPSHLCRWSDQQANQRAHFASWFISLWRYIMSRHLGFCLAAVAAIGVSLAMASAANAGGSHGSHGSFGGFFGGSNGSNGSHGGSFGGLFHHGSSG